MTLLHDWTSHMAPWDLGYSKGQPKGSLRVRHSRIAWMSAWGEGMFNIKMIKVIMKKVPVGDGITTDLGYLVLLNPSLLWDLGLTTGMFDQ